MIVQKIALLIVLSIIFWQDYSNRLVHWFWYPLLGILGFWIQTHYVDHTIALVNSGINLLFVVTVLSVLWVYSKLILKRKLINEALGIGDVLFFVFLCFCFSVISFFVLFVFSLLFSLCIHLLLKKNYTNTDTIPLAGYMALFFSIIYGLTFFINCNFIFAY